MEFFKWFTDWYGRYQVVQSIIALLKAILLPVGLAALTVFTGIEGKAPFMWIIMASTLTFMGAIVALFFSAMFAGVRTPEHKLRYINTVVGIDYGTAPNRKTDRANKSVTKTGPPQGYIEKGQVGVQLQNTASFPISAFIEFAITKIEGKDPPRSAFPKPSVTIVPGGFVNMTDDAIEFGSLMCGKLNGVMDIKIRYGKKGKERFLLEFKAKLEVFMRRDGFIQGISTGWEPNKATAISPPA